MQRLLIKLKTYSYFNLRDFLSIILVSFLPSKKKLFHIGIFETRVLIEKLLNTDTLIYKSKKEAIIIELNEPRILIKLRIKSSDTRVFCQIFLEKEYQGLLQLITKHSKIENIKHIFDCGANCGYATLYFQSLFAKAKIVAIEPSTDNFNILNENVLLNNLINVETLLAGVWKAEAYLKISNDLSVTREWSFTVEEVDDSAKHDIKGYSIDYLLNKFNIDLLDVLKIDIEGTEKYIFKEKNVDFLKRVRFIAIEIHDPNDEQLIKGKLKDLGFILSQSGEYLIGVNSLLLNK